MSASLGLYLRTIQFLRPRQIFFRFWRHVSRRYRPPYRRDRPICREPHKIMIAGPLEAAKLTGPDHFEIHGFKIRIRETSWRPSAVSDLAQYHLHYFSDLNCSGETAVEQWASDLIDHWCNNFTLPEFPAWDPYPLSLRSVNWIKWVLRGHDLSDHALSALYRQGQFLRRNLEWHLDGNHLLVNAKALVFLGLFFSGEEADGWLVMGQKMLAELLAEQVCADGGHFERSPAYHALILIDLLDLKNIESVYQKDLKLSLNTKIEAMAVWLDALTHPDGSLAHFNDTVSGMVCSREEIAAYRERLNIPLHLSGEDRLFSETQFARANRGPAALLIDFGGPAPDHIPGHAHAESLSFELSLHGEPFIRNCGISTYQRGEQRQLERGTAAHNTLCFGGYDSSEVWASFRVGARARGYLHEVELDQEAFLLKASHDGYRRLAPEAEHFRAFILKRDGLIIRDEIGGAQEKHLYFHFPPDIKLDFDSEKVVCWRRERPIAQISSLGARVSAIDSFSCLGYENRDRSSSVCVTIDSNHCLTEVSWA